jgi:hypothetical protein
MMQLLVTWATLDLVLVYLLVVLIWTQDWSTVCAVRTISSKIILDAPDGTPRRCGSCGSSFVYLEIVLVSLPDRCTVCAKHNTGSEIVLDAHDETAR